MAKVNGQECGRTIHFNDVEVRIEDSWKIGVEGATRQDVRHGFLISTFKIVEGIRRYIDIQIVNGGEILEIDLHGDIHILKE